MAVIKSYTSLEQSRKLAEFLPLESADTYWTNHYYGEIRSSMTVSSKTIEEYKELLKRFADLTDIDVFYPCWSLAALFDVLPNGIVMNKDSQTGRYHFSSTHAGTYVTTGNPIDAAYELILKLNKLNLL